MTDLDHRVLEYPAPNRDTQRPLGEHDRRTGSGRRLLGLGALLLLLGGLAFGVLRHYALHLEVTAAAMQHRDFVPSVRAFHPVSKPLALLSPSRQPHRHGLDRGEAPVIEPCEQFPDLGGIELGQGHQGYFNTILRRRIRCLNHYCLPHSGVSMLVAGHLEPPGVKDALRCSSTMASSGLAASTMIHGVARAIVGHTSRLSQATRRLSPGDGR